MIYVRSFEQIEAFLQLTDQVSQLDRLRSLLQCEMARLGFETFTYWLLCPPDGPRHIRYLSTYPLEWVRYYTAGNLKSHDLIASHSAISLRPFLWDELRTRYSFSDSQNAVFGDAREFGLKVGGCIPIHGPGNAHACFTVANSGLSDEFRTLFDHRRCELQLIALHVHDRFLQLGLQAPAKTPSLTARELEVLTWTAQGKTRWEIGEILQISEDTVKKHLLSASTRLGVSNKAHAVSKALLHRLITP